PLATSSLPVPLSPWMRIVCASLRASWPMMSRRRRVESDSPMSWSVRYLPSSRFVSRVISRRAFTSSSARLTEMRNLSRCWEAFLAGAGGVDLDIVLGEDTGDQRSDVSLVVDDQDRIHRPRDSSRSDPAKKMANCVEIGQKLGTDTTV